MQAFFTSAIGIILTSAGVLVTAVVGLLYIIGLWKKGKDGDDDRLIKILQSTVIELEKKVDNQKKDHDETLKNLTTKINTLTTKVDELEKENRTLTSVLQGRDEQTQLFYKKAFEAIEVGNKTFALVENMNKNHTDLMKMLVEHLKPGVTINNTQPK